MILWHFEKAIHQILERIVQQILMNGYKKVLNHKLWERELFLM